MHYRYPDYYEVEREKVREYATAVRTTARPSSTTTRPPNSATRPGGAADLRLDLRLQGPGGVLRDAGHRYPGRPDRPGGPGSEVPRAHPGRRQALLRRLRRVRPAGARHRHHRPQSVVSNEAGDIVQENTPPLRVVARKTERVASTMALREFSSVKVGDELPERVIPLTRQDLVNYAGCPATSTPSTGTTRSPSWSALDTAIAHGMLTMGLGGGSSPPGWATRVRSRSTTCGSPPSCRSQRRQGRRTGLQRQGEVGRPETRRSPSRSTPRPAARRSSVRAKAQLA